MKKLLLGSLVLLVFSASIVVFNISCNKESDAQQTTNCIGSQPTLKFKGNGVLYECKAVNDPRLGWIGYPGIWKIKSSDRDAYAIGFSNTKTNASSPTWFIDFPITQNTVVGGIVFLSSNLSTTTYLSSGNEISFPSKGYKYGGSGFDKSCVINISSIKNGLASGTFTGTLRAGPIGVDDTKGPLMNITEGVFTNIPVFE
jgi:hypothetical protein